LECGGLLAKSKSLSTFGMTKEKRREEKRREEESSADGLRRPSLQGETGSE
jgi:hypothetical protein